MMKRKILYGESFSKKVEELVGELEERGLVAGARLDRSGSLLTLWLLEEAWKPLSQEARLKLLKSVGSRFSALREREDFSVCTVRFETKAGRHLGVYDGQHGITLRVKEGETPDCVRVIPF